MPRFVILRHEMPAQSERPSHFDLMLEGAGMLRTWACDALPQFDRPTYADRLPDHRLAYLELEGEISEGRGTVARVAAGEYELLEELPDLLRVRLVSDEIAGVLTLARMERAADQSGAQRWRVMLDAPLPAAG
jgi:hypothetical protein